ncbi:DUF2478 domain-containing protein [Mesorhizobium sp. SP-1A]|uniref:DUF2478 domain-containing protein n=1 Tax=Mesorhizobium sp. SP-1A TaxID=3077840 RepID=UPI0028F6D0B8|nr:DUF2478 domain-containing protein [Mesorhizobium sp. SP-1A]
MNRIAAVTAEDGSDVQAFLGAMAARWQAQGVRVVGVLAEDLSGQTCSAGFLRDLTSGDVFQIFRELPPNDPSCHVDAMGIDAACASLVGRIADADLVLLSKFGKLEAGQGGLVPAFEAAFANGKPVLTTVSARFRNAWKAFLPEATSLTANETDIRRWWDSLQGDPAEAAFGAPAAE